jgi:general nucleoside transport system ATP-binding protein
MPDTSLAVEMQAITKRFPGVTANDNASLSVRHGEIHALLGENGAGKTTLMNVLYGLYQPDAGRILVRGQPVTIGGPQTAIALGIGMVHQHFMLVPVLSVVENVILGLPSGRGAVLDLAAASQKLAELAQQTGLAVDPTARVWQLPVGAQQRVEILKFLYRGADILILDEPTAVLTPDETARFFDVLRQLQARGVTIILITHKLKEVMAVSERVTVMRAGRPIATVSTRDTTPAALAQMMVGRPVLFRVEKGPAQPGPFVLEARNLRARNDRDALTMDGLSLRLRAGEILGLAGVSGNGQEELAEVLAGVRVIEAGEIALEGAAQERLEPRKLIESGVAQVPADRLSTGAIGALSVAENAVLPNYYRRPFARFGILDWRRIREFGARLIQEYDIRGASPSTAAGWLSGGNLQKLILARQLGLGARVLIAVQPTRGLDAGATEFVHRRLVAERDRGVAILLISVDLDEILSLSDRVAVMYEGRINGELERPPFDVDRLALLMAGAPA